MWEDSLNDLEGMEDYAAPMGGVSTKSGILVLLIEKNGVYKSACGAYGAFDQFMIPEGYLPTSCTCTNLNAGYTTGSGYSCPN